jgi:hypothetical protein
MKTVYFYILKCPISNDVKYVGRSVNPEVRYRQHIYSGKNEGHKDRKASWIKSLLNNGLKPIMEIIDKLEKYDNIEEVKRTEELLILRLKKTCDLKNDRDIVENGYNFSKESREKMSNAQKGNTNRRGKKVSKETLEKISKIALGRKKINKDGIEKFVLESNVQSFLDDGWKLGRLKSSEETKNKLKNAWEERKKKFGNTGKSSECVAYNKGKKLNKDNKDKRQYI